MDLGRKGDPEREALRSLALRGIAQLPRLVLAPREEGAFNFPWLSQACLALPTIARDSSAHAIPQVEPLHGGVLAQLRVACSPLLRTRTLGSWRNRRGAWGGCGGGGRGRGGARPPEAPGPTPALPPTTSRRRPSPTLNFSFYHGPNFQKKVRNRTRSHAGGFGEGQFLWP